ncbi:MAG: hypothetical protein RLY97_245 [Pseudomonadota bacterium]|jgi:hypothetical protein
MNFDWGAIGHVVKYGHTVKYAVLGSKRTKAKYALSLQTLCVIQCLATDSGASTQMVAVACAPLRPEHHGKAHPLHYKGLSSKAGALFVTGYVFAEIGTFATERGCYNGALSC